MCEKIVVFTFVLFLSIFFTMPYAQAESEFKKRLLQERQRAGEKQQEKVDVSFLIPEINYSSENLKDPFKDYLPVKPVKKEPEKRLMGDVKREIKLPGIDLQGVIWQGRIPQVIIDNNILTIGDKIKGAEIVEISREGATFLYKGVSFVVPSPAKELEKERSIKKQGG